MHKLMVICALAVPLFAAAQEGGQATVVSGNASNMALPPGMIVLSDPPLVHTPSVTLDAAPLSAGHGGFATLTWYGPGTVSGAPEEPSAAPTPTPGGSFVNVGVGTSEYSEGVAKLMAKEQPRQQIATRVYTNRDVARLVQQLDQSIGMVKYGDVTKELPSRMR